MKIRARHGIVAACVAVVVLPGAGCSANSPSAGDGRSEAATSTSGPKQDSADVEPSPTCLDYGPIQGVPDPGVCEATADMRSAYQDCILGADQLAYSFVPGSDDYWRVAKETWNLSSPPSYPKNDQTLWACLLAYQVVSEEFPGPYS